MGYSDSIGPKLIATSALSWINMTRPLFSKTDYSNVVSFSCRVSSGG